MIGKIHSVETMGLVDGPGIRFVVFFQGCRLRCAYCHNPDTWSFSGGNAIEANELMERVMRFKSYFKNSGGVTCSGGEPLMQPEFLLEFFKLCRHNGINTVLDTAGFGLGQYEEILKYTDLVILDIKHINEAGYRELTGGSIEEFFKFKEQLNKSNVKTWIRHVVVPGITDSTEHIEKLKYMAKDFSNVEKIELLPYHTLGISKYEAMGLEYKLRDLKPLDEEKIKKLEKFLL